MLQHAPHPRGSLRLCHALSSSGVDPCSPYGVFSLSGFGASNVGLLSLAGLPPGSVRYTSGVRGGLQRRTRRGPGRRRRQLQPDACRVLHHRSAGDSSPLFPVLLSELQPRSAARLLLRPIPLAGTCPLFHGVESCWALACPPFNFPSNPVAKNLRLSVALWLGPAYPSLPRLGYFWGREGEVRRVGNGVGT